MTLGITVLLRRLLLLGRPSRAVEASERALSRLEDSLRRLKRRERLLLELERGTTKLLAAAAAQVERARVVGESLSEDLREAERRVEGAERAMELLRTEHDADEAAISTLAARIKEVQAVSEANIALSNYRRASATPGGVEREL